MTASAIRLLVHGASGRMGRALLRLAAGDPRFALAEAISRNGGLVDGVRTLAADRGAAARPFDVLVDFSLAERLDAALELCLQRGAALVSGTTGLSEAQRQALMAASASIPVLWTANFSLGVAVLQEMLARSAAALPGWDCHLIETHHVHKRDAPSGTALALGQTIAAARGQAPEVLSVRAGDVVGEHRVLFTGSGECLELVHRASDRDVFARGALEAAARIVGKPPGNYALIDLLAG